MSSIEQAHEMGAQGGPATEHERLLFEAWMKGHCWAISGNWDGTTYVHESERNLRQVHPGAMNTRMLWAAWRDRAALAKQPTLQTCNCRWDGEVQVQQCTLHEAHVDAIHEWAERARTAEAKLKAQSVAWYESTAELAAVYGEMCAINETPSKDQTSVQRDRLKALRAECVELHQRRIKMNAASPVQRTSESVAIDRACFDRGCACFDPRTDKDAVIVEKRS